MSKLHPVSQQSENEVASLLCTRKDFAINASASNWTIGPFVFCTTWLDYSKGINTYVALSYLSVILSRIYIFCFVPRIGCSIFARWKLFEKFVSLNLDWSCFFFVQRDSVIEIFYEKHLGQLIDVIVASCPSVTSHSLRNETGSGRVKNQQRTKPEILSNICELLCFCVLHHPYRIKYLFVHPYDCVNSLI